MTTILIAAALSLCAQGKGVWTDPKDATLPADFKIQGEYAGQGPDGKLGAQVIALGGDAARIAVAGDSAGQVTHVTNEEGAFSFAVYRDGQSSILSPSGGAFAGIVEGSQRIAAARVQVDAVATAFVDGVNAVQANGRDLLGNPGEPIFAAGDSPTRIDVALSDPRGIAAAAVGGGVRDNRNLAGFADLRRNHESHLLGPCILLSVCGHAKRQAGDRERRPERISQTVLR